MSSVLRCLACALLCGPVAGTTFADDRDRGGGAEFFETKIRPVLVQHCHECHSAEARDLKGGLRLDTRTAWQNGGDSGPVIVPNDPDGSLLIQALRYDGYEMPPAGKLPDAVIADFVKWVEMGAPDPRESGTIAPRATIDWEAGRRFWSFQPLANPPVPDLTRAGNGSHPFSADRRAGWPQTSIDSFIVARLQHAGLEPAGPADRRTLLRRATFDLLGLPPAPDEIDDFLADDSPAAFARVVDRLLASPRYGERQARHWLDVARYAEDQAHSFRPRLYPHGWRYRDWLVKAFNDDMPWDRFVKEQIAADLLDEPDRREHLPALGFFATGPVYYGDRQLFDQYDDRIDTLTRGFLGLTVACARCHDHKYDPVPTADYYALAGVIASSEYAEAPLAPENVVREYDEAQQAIADCQKQIDEFLKAEAKRLDAREKDVEKKLPGESKERLAAMRGEMETLKKNSPPAYPVAHALRDAEESRNLKVNIRGDPKNQGDEVPRRFLRILTGDDPPAFTSGSGRRELAEAIASADNPLTSRVIVNRVWQQHFGRGLVATPSNFGTLGEPPTHPELLDHLATRFVARGWSIKQLRREVMLSAAYQLSSGSAAVESQPPSLRNSTELSGSRPSTLDSRPSTDPDNRLLWRQNRRRLEVEPWRDAMLAVAGTLDATFGGPSLDLAGRNNRRRTLYAKISRHQLDPLLRLVDFPDPNITAGTRPVTTVPLQQLFVLNSPFVLEQSRAFARRLAASAEDDAGRVKQAYLLAFGRPPTEDELQRDLEFVLTAEATDKLSAWEQFAQVLLGANEFLYVD
ncbi:MAG TPA: PSD1 and planctomycete cytochrome C domain-containing protein [Planctomycetaceae bacterium]|nr:PSD1 and planctomycete cytochrome C domain-containing protein [Planctomycetaceae bacterium]